MSGPRLILPLALGDCSPFVNCTQRDALRNHILSLDFEDDGMHSTMTCAQSSASYVILCQDFYQNLIQVQTSPNAETLIQTMNGNDRDAYGMLLIALLICVILIIVLVLTNLTLITKIRQATDNGQSELLEEVVEMKEQLILSNSCNSM